MPRLPLCQLDIDRCINNPYKISNNAAFVTENTNGQFYWGYRGLHGFLEMREGQKPKFSYRDEKRKLMYSDLIDMSAPAHTFAIKNDLVTGQCVHNQLEKRAANILSQYCTNSGKKNWAKLDGKTLKFHI